MLKKTVTFKDLDGNDVTEDFYFNVSKAEIAELEMTFEGGYAMHLQRVIAAQNGKQIIETFKGFISNSVGKRSEDGRRFIKNQEITDSFLQSDAYSVVLVELLTDADKAAEFVRSVFPADLADNPEVKAAMENVSLPNTVTKAEVDASQPAWLRERREPTLKELDGATPEQMREAFRIREEKNRA